MRSITTNAMLLGTDVPPLVPVRPVLAMACGELAEVRSVNMMELSTVVAGMSAWNPVVLYAELNEFTQVWASAELSAPAYWKNLRTWAGTPLAMVQNQSTRTTL